MLDTRLLQCFAVVAEELHFGRAAERLCMTQPPLSQNIRKLEAQLQVQLLVRNTRSVRLTPAGELLSQRIADLEREMTLTTQAVQALHGGKQGPVRVALTPSAAYSIVPECLHAFRRMHPDMIVELHEMNSSDMPDALRRGRLDMALMRPPFADADFHPQRILVEPMMLAIRHDHHLAQSRAAGHGTGIAQPARPQQLHAIPLAEALKLDLIGYMRQSSRYFHEVLQRLSLHAGVMPDIVHESMIPTVLALVEAGVGAAIVPANLSRARPDTIAYLPLQGCGDIQAELLLARPPQGNNRAVDNLADIMRRWPGQTSLRR